jgi:fucose 4-O-acetylase-like acetyltransferase
VQSIDATISRAPAGRSDASPRKTRDGAPAKRLAYLETLRGLACILLVSWHVVGDGTGTTGLRLPVDHPLEWSNFIFTPLRMPLFAFISGYVFNAFVESVSGAGEVLRQKARRLLLPLAVVGTLHFVLQSLAKGQHLRDVWHVYFDSYEHFWFLQVTFIIMALLLAVNLLLKGRELVAAAICLAIAAPLYLVDVELEPVNWFSVTKVLYLAPFFFMGQLFRRAGVDARLRDNSAMRVTLLFAVGAAIAALYLAFANHVEILGLPFSKRSAPMLILSLLICTFLFALRWENRTLTWIGSYAYAIFLLHVIFAAGFRTFEGRFVSVHDPYLIWALSLMIGLAGPAAASELLQRGPPILKTLFLGVRYTPRDGMVGGRMARDAERGG